MIGNPYKGRSFKGLIRYLHHGRANDPKPHRVIWSEGRNIATTDDKVIPAIMIATAELSSGVKKSVYHLPISWPPEEKLAKSCVFIQRRRRAVMVSTSSAAQALMV